MSIKMTVADRRFAPLFWTQFIGALNDNVFKNALVMMVTFQNVTVFGLDKAQIVALSGGLFILPFFLFSPIAGQISDKTEKSRLIRITKYWEVLIMGLACYGFYSHHFELLLVVLFLAGVQSALFGPVKYSMIPDLVRPEKLLTANAYVELGTFLAILLGTIAGGLLAEMTGAETWIMGSLMALALLGVVSAVFVTEVPIAAPDLVVRYNPFANFRSLLAIVKEKTAVYNSILGISWFWFFGAAVLSILPVYCKDFLNVDGHVVTCFLAMFTLGIGAGSILCEKLSFGRVELGLVPIGSLGMSVFLLYLYFCRPEWGGNGVPLIGFSEFFSRPEGPRLMIDFFLMSVFGGFFILPLYTLIQERCAPGVRSRVIAANNILNAVYMVVASVTVMAFNAFHLSYPAMFLILSAMNVVAAVYIYFVVPEFTLRFQSWILARLIYRIRAVGEENIPASGPALLVCNHVSYVDWLVIYALVKRPVRFVMYYKFFEIPFVRHLMKQAGVIAIAGAKEDPEILRRAFEQMGSALERGELVCIFPEGKLTRDGKMDVFRPGVERLLKSHPVPVVPMALVGLWGTFFTHGGGLIRRHLPRHWLAPVRLVIGRAVAGSAASAAARANGSRGS